MRTTSSLLASVAAIACASAQAQPDYRCKIERIHNAAGEDESSLIEHERKAYVDKEFSVDRRSGAMSGALKNNYVTRPQVVDIGSADNSFKSVATLKKGEGLGPGSAVFTLVVNEYVETSAKPFVFLSNDVAYFGKCLHDK